MCKKLIWKTELYNAVTWR